MSKSISILFIVGSLLFAQSASAAYATAFSRASATWKAQDSEGTEYEIVWTKANESSKCGSNCRIYRVWCWLPINTDNGQPLYKLDRTYGRLWKNGTEGADPYYSSDFDFRNTSGSWTSEDYSNNYISDNGRRYYAYKSYGTDLSSNYDYEIRFYYKYTSNYSWCQRRIDFSYGGIG